jgi:hypothetical protein
VFPNGRIFARLPLSRVADFAKAYAFLGGWRLRIILGYRHDRALAAADACSSSRPSRAAASQSTHPRPRRPRSGSTPHDALIADPAPHRSAPFWPALARQHTRLCRSARLARDRTANPVEQRAIRSFAPARTPKIRAKAIRSPASAQLPQHSRRRQIPIAPLHCRCLTPRDFVPWRFSDAGCPSVGMVPACRHPKTCT